MSQHIDMNNAEDDNQQRRTSSFRSSLSGVMDMMKNNSISKWSSTILIDNPMFDRSSISDGTADDTCEPCKNDEDSLSGWPAPTKFVVSLLMGMTFGFVFARSRVFEPMVIRGQFELTNFAMMKMFLAAAGTSALVFSAVQFTSLRERFLAVREIKGDDTRNWRGLFLGGFLLGIGMGLGGACPGMVLPQLGAGVPNAIFTYVGGFVGAILYGLTEQFVKPLIHHKPSAEPDEANPAASCEHRRADTNGPTRSVFIDKHMGWSARKTMFVVGVIAAVAVVLLEIFFPWYDELPRPNLDGCNLFTCHAAPPWLAGIALGAMQLPAILFLSSLLGTSSSYCAMTSSWTNFTSWGKDSLSYMHKLGEFTFAKWWQVFFVLAAVFGAWIAEISAGGLVEITGLPPATAFFGGFLMLYGSRMADGCTSGHGISGAPALMIASAVAVVGMFSGAFAIGLVWTLVAPGTYVYS